MLFCFKKQTKSKIHFSRKKHLITQKLNLILFPDQFVIGTQHSTNFHEFPATTLTSKSRSRRRKNPSKKAIFLNERRPWTHTHTWDCCSAWFLFSISHPFYLKRDVRRLQHEKPAQIMLKFFLWPGNFARANQLFEFHFRFTTHCCCNEFPCSSHDAIN